MVVLVVVMGVVGERRRRRGDRFFFAGLGDWMMGRCAFCSSAAFLASAGKVLGIEGERESSDTRLISYIHHLGLHRSYT